MSGFKVTRPVVDIMLKTLTQAITPMLQLEKFNFFRVKSHLLPSSRVGRRFAVGRAPSEPGHGIAISANMLSAVVRSDRAPPCHRRLFPDLVSARRPLFTGCPCEL